MCLLGSRWWIITFRGPKSPQTPIGISSQICEKFKQLYLQICVSDWYEIWQAAAASNRDFVGGLVWWQNNFQDDGRPPFWKSIYRHISVKNHPISMKFCTQQQILKWMKVTWSKMKKLHRTDSEFDRTYFLLIMFWVFFCNYDDVTMQFWVRQYSFSCALRFQ